MMCRVFCAQKKCGQGASFYSDTNKFECSLRHFTPENSRGAVHRHQPSQFDFSSPSESGDTQRNVDDTNTDLCMNDG